MKRFSVALLAFAMFISVIPFTGFAEETNEQETIIFEDGSYMTETIIEISARASGTKTGSKVKRYYDADGNLEWTATLTGTFTYTGSGSTCTASSCSITVSNSAWYTVSKSATKSGNTANATVVMGKKVLGVTVTKVSANVSLSCDANGNLS